MKVNLEDPTRLGDPPSREGVSTAADSAVACIEYHLARIWDAVLDDDSDEVRNQVSYAMKDIEDYFADH